MADKPKIINKGWQSAVVNEDLARFLIAQFITTCGIRSVEEIRKTFSVAAEFEGIVDDVFSNLESLGVIEIKNDVIKMNKFAVDVNESPESLERFLPRLMKLASDRVLQNSKSGEHKQKKEFLRFFTIPDDPETVAEARAIYSEFVAKMRQVIERAGKENRKSESVRFVGVVGCSLVPEDFI